MRIDFKKCKLYRAVYDHYGQFYIESSWPKEQFEKEAAKGYGIKYVLGVRVKRNRHYVIDSVVEGPEEVLRYILELIAKFKSMENKIDDLEMDLDI